MGSGDATVLFDLDGVLVDSAETIRLGLTAWARARGAVLLQVTSDRGREDAHRFYERLGHTTSHPGFKEWLT
ncbi:GNAT family protein [Nocardiopsis lambiniae]|uniref:hypothetical protein n=1 Tax=Nocardiopsis lambiniae TaxID=3075539 RepID=UPI0037C84B4C